MTGLSRGGVFKMTKDISINKTLEMSKELWEENKEKWSPMTPEYGRDSILYMIEEIGEVISIVKKKGQDKIMNDPEIREHFIEEMCDVMMYYSDVLNRFDVTSEEFAHKYYEKFHSNMKRNYTKDHDES